MGEADLVGCGERALADKHEAVGRQIDDVVLRLAEVGDLVAVAGADPAVVQPEEEPVGPRTAGEDIDILIAIDQVVAVAAVDLVLAFAAEKGIDIAAAADDIVVIAAVT